ncbi:MAG: ABC transporter permease, partial [Anaerolineae bacterium]|nr:ABC transporter permease [Anaerolineae bacterium]
MTDIVLRHRRKRAAAEDQIFTASQTQLIWWRFRKHKMAIVGITILIILYVLAIFCEFFSPYEVGFRHDDYEYAPPQRIRIVDSSGKLRAPFVYGQIRERHPVTLRYTFKEDETQVYPIRLFVRGQAYKMWGAFEGDRHLFGIDAPEGGIFLFGTDKLGRDLLSRILYGSRISLSIGLLGVFLSFVFGLLIGGASGFFGGVVDEIIQRVIELLRSIPTIPLWMSLSAALPRDWPIMRIYFGITILLSMVSWTALARVVRGKLLSLREEDFVMAARLAGSGEWRIITTHLLPSFASHIIVSITGSIPGMILGETSLSFLGLGLQPPAVSWGVLL